MPVSSVSVQFISIIAPAYPPYGPPSLSHTLLRLAHPSIHIPQRREQRNMRLPDLRWELRKTLPPAVAVLMGLVLGHGVLEAGVCRSGRVDRVGEVRERGVAELGIGVGAEEITGVDVVVIAGWLS